MARIPEAGGLGGREGISAESSQRSVGDLGLSPSPWAREPESSHLCLAGPEKAADRGSRESLSFPVVLAHLHGCLRLCREEALASEHKTGFLQPRKDFLKIPMTKVFLCLKSFSLPQAPNHAEVTGRPAGPPLHMSVHCPVCCDEEQKESFK